MRKIQIDEFIHFVQPSNMIKNATSGVFFLLTSVSMESDEYKSSLFELKDNFDMKELGTFGEGILQATEFVCWAESGKAIVRKSGNDSHYEYLLWNIQEKSFKKLFYSKNKYEKIVLASGSDYIGLYEKNENDSDYIEIERVPFWADGEGYINNRIRRIALIHKNFEKDITNKNMDVMDFVFLEEENRIIFYVVMRETVQKTENLLFSIDLSSNECRELKQDTQYVISNLQLIDKDHLLVVRSDKKTYGEYQDEFIDFLTLSSMKYVRLNNDSRYHLYDDINSDVCPQANFVIDFGVIGNKVYFTATENDSCHLMEGDLLSGNVRQITSGIIKITDFTVDEAFAYISAMKGLCGNEIYKINLKTLEEVKMTDLHKKNLSEIAQDPQKIVFINSDNEEISGYYIKPIIYNENEKVPTILFIHGGPNTAYGACYYHEMQYFASQGYGVIYCNPRGSAGKGGEFEDLREKFGTIDFDDLMSFLKYAITILDWIDVNRLAVAGGSYGGMMTNWIIGHTNIFKAAISDRCVSNQISDFATSDIGISCGMDSFSLDPWRNINKLWNFSPLKYAHRVKTPTLFIQGDEDFRCYKDQAIQMFVALKYFNVPSKLVLFKNEDHSLCREGKPSHRVKRLKEMEYWLNEYLQKRNM